nr:WYL domain-containing protein [Streptomyces sp. SID13031]
MEDRRIKVLYRRWEAPREVERTLEPYGLVLKNGTWYVVAAAPDREAGQRISGVRTYRVSNILQLAPTEETFTRPPGFDLAKRWQEHLDRFEQDRFTAKSLVRISPGLVGRLADLSATLLLKAIADTGAEPAEDGSITVAVPIESIGNAATQLIRYGKSLEVLEPPELRAELKQLAEEVAGLYS